MQLNTMYLPHQLYDILKSFLNLQYKHPSLLPRTDHQSPDLHNIIKRRRLGEYLPRKLMKSSYVSYTQPIVDRRSLWKGLQQCVSSERAALPQYISKPKATAALTAVSWSFSTWVLLLAYAQGAGARFLGLTRRTLLLLHS